MFLPKRLLFEKEALNYKMGNQIYEYFKENKNVEIVELKNNRVKENIPGEDLYNLYREGKNSLVVGIKKGMKFQTCKPSAHYQLPLMTGCIGHCQYCYLNTHLGERPYLKINVNMEDILEQAEYYMKER